MFLLACLAVLFALFVRNVIADAFYPFSLENGEGLCLAWSLRLARGEALYPPLTSALPFIGCNYPPLYLLAWSAGVSGDAPSFFVGRLLTGLAMLGIGAGVYGLGRRLGAGRRSCLFGALLFYVIPFVNITGMLCRVDAPAVALGLAGIILYLPPAERAQSRWTWHQWLGLGIMALAVFTKQTALAPAAAAILWVLLRRRDWAARTIIGLGAAALLLYGTLAFATSGQALAWIGPYSSGRYSAGLLVSAWRRFAVQAFLLLIPAAVFAGAGLYAAARAGKRQTGVRFLSDTEGFFAIYLLLSLGSTLLVARAGSSFHYFLESTALLGLVVGLGLDRLRKSPAIAPTKQVAAALAFGLLFSFHIMRHGEIIERWDSFENTMLHRRDEKMLRVARAFPSPILTEEPSYAVLNGHPPYVENPFLYSDLVRRGLLDPAPLLEDLARGHVRFVCLNSDVRAPNSLTRDRFAPEILEAVARWYPEVWSQGDRFLYFRTPEDRDRATRAARGHRDTRLPREHAPGNTMPPNPNQP